MCFVYDLMLLYYIMIRRKYNNEIIVLLDCKVNKIIQLILLYDNDFIVKIQYSGKGI